MRASNEERLIPPTLSNQHTPMFWLSSDIGFTDPTLHALPPTPHHETDRLRQ